MGQESGLTRRQMALAGSALAAASPALAQSGPTVAEVARRIEETFGAGWQGGRGDGLAAGDPTLRVTGVAVTVSPTIEALRQAQARSLNMMVAIEAPFYSRPFTPPPADNPFAAMAVRNAEALAVDPILVGKKAFIERGRLAVYRLNDSLRARKPEPLAVAAGEALGWRRDPTDERIHILPQTPLRQVIAHVRRTLRVDGGLRVIGDPDMPIRRVLVVPGTTEPVSVVKAMPQVDALLAGDLREWEVVEYIVDSDEAGHPKALIATGRILSEQPGMAECAAWLRTVLKGVRVETIATKDPYWRLPA